MLASALHSVAEAPTLLVWVVLALAFAMLAKCADFFVDGSVTIANRLRIPKLVIGIVLVSLATTMPELSVSMLAAQQGRPEMALGNAIGSVICNCGLALALCGIFSRKPVPVQKQAFRLTGSFLAIAVVLLFLLVFPDGTLGHLEGGLLLLLFVAYLCVLFHQHRKGRLTEVELPPESGSASPPILRSVVLFLAGLGGVILASRFVVVSSVTLAQRFGVPEALIALTLVALGTSVPEVATSVTAAIKGQGALSVGNILGANIMNICWVAGASALVNPLYIAPREILFMFPAMFTMTGVTLFVLHSSATLTRREGIVLASCYVTYLLAFFILARMGL